MTVTELRQMCRCSQRGGCPDRAMVDGLCGYCAAYHSPGQFRRPPSFGQRLGNALTALRWRLRP